MIPSINSDDLIHSPFYGSNFKERCNFKMWLFECEAKTKESQKTKEIKKLRRFFVSLLSSSCGVFLDITVN